MWHRRIFFEKNNEYTRVKYLGSDNHAWCDIGINGNDDDLEFEVTFYFNKKVYQPSPIFGNHIDGSHNYTRCSIREETLYVNFNGTNIMTFGGLKLNAINNIVLNKANVIINGRTNKISQTKGVENNQSIRLFNLGELLVYRDIGLRIYNFTIKRNGVVIQKILPVQINMAGYMLDTVTNTFFGNRGDSEYVIGDTFNGEYPMQLNYLQSDGTQYINTGYIINPRSKIIADLEIVSKTSTTTNRFMFGAANSTHMVGVTNIASNDNALTIYNGLRDNSVTINNVQFISRSELILDKDKFTGYGIEQSTATRDATMDYPLYIFGIISSGDILPYKFGILRVYGLKIYEDDTLIMDLIPCLTEEGISCMMDKVTNNFYINNGNSIFLTE